MFTCITTNKYINAVYDHYKKNKLYYCAAAGAIGITLASTCIYSYLGHFSPVMSKLRSLVFSFEPNLNKPTVLLLESTSDPEGAFNLSHIHNQQRLKDINHFVDLKFKKITDASEVCQEINASKRPVDALILAAHGSSNLMDYSYNNTSPFFTSQIEKVWNASCFQNLRKEAPISLCACKTGKGPNSFGEVLSKITNRRVIAPETSIIARCAHPIVSDTIPMGLVGYDPYAKKIISRLFDPTAPKALYFDNKKLASTKLVGTLCPPAPQPRTPSSNQVNNNSKNP